MTDQTALFEAYCAWEAASEVCYANVILRSIHVNVSAEQMARDWNRLNYLHSRFLEAANAVLDVDSCADRPRVM
jgi:hypothetical protein